MKVNFNKIPIFTGIDKSKTVLMDIRKDFADLVYKNGTGIEAHSLALKIYEGKEEIDIDEFERDTIIQYAEKHCTPIFMDSIKTYLQSMDANWSL